MHHLRLRIIALILVLWPAASHGRILLAAEQGVSLPPLATMTSLRQSILFIFNGRPLLACKNEFESPARLHGACHALATLPDTTPYVGGVHEGSINEFVWYDGTDYERFNDDPMWTASPLKGYDPGQTTMNQLLFGSFIAERAATSVISRLGTTTIGNALATHYQFWSLDKTRNAASGGQYVYDIFISDQGYPVQDGESLRGTLSGLGEGQLNLIDSYSDFNMPIKVYRPGAEQVRVSRITTPSTRDTLPLRMYP